MIDIASSLPRHAFNDDGRVAGNGFSSTLQSQSMRAFAPPPTPGLSGAKMGKPTEAPQLLPFNAPREQVASMIGTQTRSMNESYENVFPKKVLDYLNTPQSKSARTDTWVNWLNLTEHNDTRHVLANSDDDGETNAFSVLFHRPPDANPVTGRPWDKLEPMPDLPWAQYAQEQGYTAPASIGGLQVEPQSRRQGLGRSHIEEIEKRARAAGNDGLFVTLFDDLDPSSFAFAEKMGFESTGLKGKQGVPSTPGELDKLYPVTYFVKDLRDKKPDEQSGQDITIDPSANLHMILRSAPE
jgi:GNAT superfamily N-acetyltransferase